MFYVVSISLGSGPARAKLLFEDVHDAARPCLGHLVHIVTKIKESEFRVLGLGGWVALGFRIWKVWVG